MSLSQMGLFVLFEKCVSGAVLGSAHVKRKIQIRKRLLSSGDSAVTLNYAEWHGLISCFSNDSLAAVTGERCRFCKTQKSTQRRFFIS